MIRIATVVPALLGCLVVTGAPLFAQESSLDALLAEADSASPRIHAARRAAEGAAARVPQAGAPPDPTVGLTLMNVPVADPGLGNDMMTMTQLQVATRLPWPGKLGLQEAAAALLAEASEWDVERVRDEVRSEVKTAYYELYFVDRALDVTRRNGALLQELAQLTASRYAVGAGRQPDVLRAQVERTRLTEQGVTLRDRRVTAEARLNALLGRPHDLPIPAPELPERLRAGALEAGAGEPTFTSSTILDPGRPARIDDPLSDVGALQDLALASNPTIRAHELRVASEGRRRELAGTAVLPDFNVSAGYSWRRGLGDFFSVMLSAPVPIFSGRKQSQGVVEAEAMVEARRAGLQATVAQLRGEIAGLASDLQRVRDQLTLLNDGILPQARTGLSSATASYRVGGVDFLALLDAQVTLFRHELDYHRLMADFGTTLAALERAVGAEVLP